MLTLLLACSGSEPSPEVLDQPAKPELIELRLALNWFPEAEFGGFYEGVLGGHYEEAGFAVEIIPGGPGAPTLELMASGKAEAAISAADDLLVKRSKGATGLGVWPAFQLAPHGLMVHAGSAQTLQDVKGPVAIEPGSPLERHLAARLGWDARGVERVPYSGSIGPFVTDTALSQQAYVTSEPCVARSKGVEVDFLRASEAGWNPYGSLLVLPEPLPDWAPAFVEATQTAWEAYSASPERAHAEISRLNPDMNAELLACIFEAQAPFVTGDEGLGAMSASRWDEMNEVLVELELLPAESSAEGAWKALR